MVEVLQDLSRLEMKKRPDMRFVKLRDLLIGEWDGEGLSR